jgi:hypothetical protein
MAVTNGKGEKAMEKRLGHEEEREIFLEKEA